MTITKKNKLSLLQLRSIILIVFALAIGLIPTMTYAQKGMGDYEGVGRQQVKPDVIPLEGIIEKIRIALGAVAPTVIRSHETEQFLTSKTAADANVIEEAMKSIRKECHPIDDIRSPAWYRCQMTGILLKRTLESLSRS